MSRLIFGWLTWLASSLPPWLGYALADLATGPHWYGFPERRHAVLANLAVILPRASRSDRVKIGKRIQQAIKPKFIRVAGYWYPRGGMPIDVFWQSGKLPSGVWLPETGVSSYRGRG